MSRMPWIERVAINSRLYAFVFRHTYLKWFLDFCDIRGKCLELGCGAGVVSSEIMKRFDVEITATDVDEDEVALAKKRLMGCDVVQADALSLHFKDGSFDCVVESCVLQHMADYPKALREMHRVLKKGGSVFMMDVSRWFMWPFSEMIEHYEGGFTKDDMLRELKGAGFRIAGHKGKDIFIIHAKKI